MAFTEEQEQAILAFCTPKTPAPATPPVTPPAAPAAPAVAEVAPIAPVAPVAPAPLIRTIAQQAKHELAEEAANAGMVAEIHSSVNFNHAIKDFVEKNKDLLPVEASKILSTASSKSYADENAKANTTRKALLDSFLALQENVDSLTVSLATRANDYGKLTESEKEKRSSEFWDLVETGTVLKQGTRKADALNKINGSKAGESSNPLEDKILAAATRKFNNQNK